VSQDSAGLAETTSLCPTCLDRVPGRYEARDGAVHLVRTCPDHGTESRQVWGSLDHWEWARDFGPDPTGEAAGPLTVDNDHACLAVVEVTADCNLSCSFCFASSGPGGPELPFEEVVGLFETVIESGGVRPIQLSGGEPTVRDDLPELIEHARGMGFEHVQVNTNGLRLAREDGYARELADAGATAVYLQFDGLDPATYEAIRGVDIAAEKHAALDACRAAELPVVLVPTVVPGTNDDEMGDVVRYALDNRDVVESVNFQPVAGFGRYEAHGGRFSLDEAARRLADQFGPLEPRDLVPIPCCSSYCQSATALLPAGDDGDGGGATGDAGPAAGLVGDNEEPVPLTRFLESELFESLAGGVDEADWMELLASTPAGMDCAGGACCGSVPEGAGRLLADVLPVSFTGFMDAAAADVERLDNCCVSVPTASGELVPFCAFNMTTDDGEYALRTRNGWGGRPAVDADAEAADLRGDGGTVGSSGADSVASGCCSSGSGCCAGTDDGTDGTDGMDGAARAGDGRP